MLAMKSGKRHLTNEMELPNQDKLKTFGEKKTLIYFGILKLTPSNKWRRKKKFKKNILQKVNHLTYIDDIKRYAKNEKELGTLSKIVPGENERSEITFRWQMLRASFYHTHHVVRIYRKNIGMAIGMEKSAMLVMKSGKRRDKIRILGEKETYKYLGILEANSVTYWPRPSCQKKKYTCVNNWCIRSKISGGDLDCRGVELSANCDARKK